MTTHALATASPPVVAPVALDLDARMALGLAVMGERCDLAILAVDINTAHLPGADPIPAVTAPLPLTPTAAPNPHSTPVAGLLHDAHQQVQAGGWCTGTLRDERGATCLMGAIRKASGGNRSLETQGAAVLLDAIQREFGPVESVPAFNDAWGGSRTPIRLLGQAADLAASRGM